MTPSSPTTEVVAVVSLTAQPAQLYELGEGTQVSIDQHVYTVRRINNSSHVYFVRDGSTYLRITTGRAVASNTDWISALLSKQYTHHATTDTDAAIKQAIMVLPGVAPSELITQYLADVVKVHDLANFPAVLATLKDGDLVTLHHVEFRTRILGSDYSFIRYSPDGQKVHVCRHDAAGRSSPQGTLQEWIVSLVLNQYHI